jgi:predicted nucleic acid-binding protein
VALKYLLDSTLLIDHFNDVDAATEFLAKHGRESAISVVTMAEVLAGSLPKEQEAHELLLDQHPCLAVDALTAKAAAALRRQKHWKLADSFQAALALRHGMKLVTRNTKDFDPKKLDFIHVPYRF